MPRTIHISAPSARAEQIVDELQKVDGIVAIQHQRGSSIRPRGDVVSAQTTVEGLTSVYRILDRIGLGKDICITTSEPQSLVSPAHEKAVDDETNEASLEEMGSMLRRETNISNNYWAMAMGAVFATLILRLIEPQSGAGFAEQTWVQFWSSVTPAGVLIALLASAAGMAIVASQRSVLSAGVMIALALVPGMTIFGMGLSTGNLELAGSGLLRWAVDAICVLLAGAVVLSIKRAMIHRRVSLG